MGIKVITNNVPRKVFDAYELTKSERADFDYLNWDAIAEGKESASFFRYKDQWYDLSQFTTTSSMSQTPEFKDWDGYMSDSFFSGLLIRWANTDHDSVVVARFYQTD